MNGYQVNGKTRGSEKPVPGCLGRMVNLFDLTSSISGNRLLTDKPYNDGSLSRSRSDGSRISNVAIDEMEDKVIVSESRRSSSNRKPNGTPVKTLIAQEMSKDLELKKKSPNLVAKLMGLDAIPQKESDLSSSRIQSRLYSQNSNLEIPKEYLPDEFGVLNKFDCESHSHVDQNEYKDIYEILQQSHKTNLCKRDKSPQKGRPNDNVNDKKLALIRQKFMEAKRLATDEKLRRTKEFQDALDVLSSNGDLFLKVLQEPNSFISQHICLDDSITSSPETKRITLLKPSKMLSKDNFSAPFGKRNEKQVNKQDSRNEMNSWENENHGFPPNIQPTRIVVLKPSPGKGNEPKVVVSSNPSSPRVLMCDNFFEEEEDEESREAREVAKEITEQMRKNLAGHRRDETLLSSVLSNGYTGDESSFEKSENEFEPENVSDSEVMSQVSRHSWDYVNRYGSPFSLSSFSRASYSPESAVCREAKKRLSERWAMMMASNCNNNNTNNNGFDEPSLRRSSSTLGEMLALSEVKNSEICEEEENDKDQDLRGSTLGLNSNMGTKESGALDSPRNLSRSKSVPASSSSYGERLNVEVVSDSLCNKKISKEKTSKTSFTGKVTSLFFSRNKKSRKEKTNKSPSNDESHGFQEPSGRISDEYSEGILSPTSKYLDTRARQGICSPQGNCVPQAGERLLQGENQDQPSPISVLEFPFEEDDSLFGCSSSIVSNPHGDCMPLGRSNLIDNSSLSRTLARTLSWDESFSETPANYPLNSPYVSLREYDDEIDYHSLVQSLLTMAGLDDKGDSGSIMARWHSLESPLNPFLREKFIDLSTNEPLHEAKRRHLRSSKKLVFDCVNSALLDITGFKTSSRAGPFVCHNNRHLESGPGLELSDKVWAWMKELLPGEGQYFPMDDGDNHNLVERLVWKEVRGKGWIEEIKVQVESIGKEIEGKLIQELVEESVIEWTCRE